MDLLLYTSQPHLGQTLAKSQGDLCELRFKHRNLERRYQLLEFKAQESEDRANTLAFDVKYMREKFTEI
jgi:hypothetical protein